MRTIETLVRGYPDKTGHEILAMQEQDKIEDQENFEKLHQRKLETIKDINENGGYYKGRFGLNQLHLWRFFNMRMEENGEIWCDTEVIYIHFDNKQVVTDNGIIITREIKTYQKYTQYCPQPEDRIDKKEWDRINDYIDKTKDFWK